VRWRLLTELADSDYRVRGLVTWVGQPQNLISYHLRLLRDGGLVTSTRAASTAGTATTTWTWTAAQTR
jgi:ArsR family transcriptional regulator, arsenate/arsenite/antimonite-responsive transcriptional repressor / arsenate reductase (thioredoxin)